MQTTRFETTRLGIASTCDLQSEVGKVFGEIGGELPAKFGRRFSSFFCWENRQKRFPKFPPKLHRKFHHQTPLQLRFLVVAGPSTLLFLSLPFWKTARKTAKKTRISSACRTPTIFGKEGKTLKIARNSLKRKKARKTKKARKRRLGYCTSICVSHS